MGKQISTLILVILLILIALVIPVSSETINSKSTGTTWYVNDDGGDVDYTNIQTAIDQAQSGDIIWVYSGLYYESIKIIDKNLKLIGKSFEKSNPDLLLDKPIIDVSKNNNDAVEIINSECVISGFKIQNSNEYNNGIYVEDSKNCNINRNEIIKNENGIVFGWGQNSNNIIQNNRISNNRADGISTGWGLSSSNDVIIYNNTIINNNENGITISDTSYSDISQNLILNNQGNGIKLYDTDNTNINNNTITANKEDGILMINSAYLTINDNIVKNNNEGISLDRSYINNYINNTISHNNKNGINMVFSEENKFINNFINNNKNGIDIGFTSEKNKFIKNFIINNKKNGIEIYCSNNNSISKNNISDNKENGIYIRFGFNNVIYQNNFQNNNNNAKDDDVNIWYLKSSKTGNYWDDYEIKYPNAIKIKTLGIWSMPYEITGKNNIDKYPLIKEYNQPINKMIKLHPIIRLMQMLINFIFLKF